MMESVPPSLRVGTFDIPEVEEANYDDVETSTVQGDVENNEKIVIGNRESKRVFYTRALVLAVLVGVAASVSAVVFLYARNVEEANFESYFQDVSGKVVSEFIGGADRRITAIQSFANQITSYALSKQDENNGTSIWPNVALPDFERRARFAIELSDVLSLIFFPIVTKETRASWESFAVENQGWLKEGLQIQGIPEEEYNQGWIAILNAIREPPEDLQIVKELFRINGTGAELETGPGPYAPWWQFAPVFPASTVVNYNAFSHPTRVGPIQSVLDNKKPLVTEAFDYADETAPGTVGRKAVLNLFLQHGIESNRNSYEAGPASDIYVPIFENYDEGSENVVGEITAYVYWQIYFENVLSERDVGIFVILENTCDQTYTYRVDGSDASYLGQGDLHDTAYDHLEVTTEYGSFVQFEGDLSELPAGQCLYRLRVYPSTELQDVFTTNGPMRFSLILAGTFAFTCLVFLLYDFLVERRQRIVMDTAVKSTAVVASLFPEEVRDRLYEKETAKHNKQDEKHNKKGFMTDTTPSTPTTSEEDGDQELDPLTIADLYPNCTVLFCDIVGFTHWSSTRDPISVFKLLETVFKSFDKVATRLGVFKVETIGDCYVAVTGLPHAQPDHAIVMAKFAAECTSKLSRVTHRLADQLGPETAELKVRIGMHSGPVTAGVLRGAKARFQLFGDTVNTAARMESTGLPMKIHVSSATAQLIRDGGYSDWIRERVGEVEAKGKGRMQTSWLEPKCSDHSTTGPMSEWSSH